MKQLAKLATDAGEETVELLFTAMEQNRRDAEWVGNAIQSYDKKRIAELEKENKLLRMQLKGMEDRLMWIITGNLYMGDDA